MIYISSSCIQANKISEVVSFLFNRGISHIELSGGTKYYSEITDDLLDFKERSDVHFMLHNYFPPPDTPIVLNLASNDPLIAQLSLEHINKALALSALLDAPKYAFHAGFSFDPKPEELGGYMAKTKTQSLDSMKLNFIKQCKQIHSDTTKIYIENNVISFANYKQFDFNPFMLVDADDYYELKKELRFNLLLDIAHLKVSCNVLSKNFNAHLEQLVSETDYVHLSDNDGQHDGNLEIKKDSSLYSVLKNLGLKGKTVTLEIYKEIDEVLRAKELIENLM